MITQAFDYKIWADERTLCAIDEMDSSCSIDSYSFALQQVNHMVIVEDLFKSRLIGQPAPHESTNTLLVPKFEELKNRLLASGRWYLDYAHFIHFC